MLTNLTIILSVIAVFLVVLWAIRNDMSAGSRKQTGLFAMKNDFARDTPGTAGIKDRSAPASRRDGGFQP